MWRRLRGQLEVLFTDQRTLITDRIGLQVTGDGLQDIFHGSIWQRSTNNEQRSTFFANFKGAKRARFGGQGGQVRKVEKSLDGSGFSSRGPRGPSGFRAAVAASI